MTPQEMDLIQGQIELAVTQNGWLERISGRTIGIDARLVNLEALVEQIAEHVGLTKQPTAVPADIVVETTAKTPSTVPLVCPGRLPEHLLDETV